MTKMHPELLRSIAVVEDDAAICADFVSLVETEPCFRLAGAAGTLSEAARFVDDPPEIVLIDLMLPDGSAFDLISALSETGRSKIIVISVLGDERAVVSAFRAGAHGYLMKGATGFELRDAIYQTLSGNAPISPSIARFLIKEFRELPGTDAEPAEPLLTLSKREREVLQCLAVGSTDKETARTLGVSPYTVADHLRSVFRKLQVKTRAAAVARAIDSGEVQLGAPPATPTQTDRPSQ
ncbi:MAG: response regulator transcription factor [Pseudomonadota bacterium]